jgi:hypothetical protein
MKVQEGSLASRIYANQEEMKVMLDARLGKDGGKSRRTEACSSARGGPAGRGRSVNFWSTEETAWGSDARNNRRAAFSVVSATLIATQRCCKYLQQ